MRQAALLLSLLPLLVVAGHAQITFSGSGSSGVLNPGQPWEVTPNSQTVDPGFRGVSVWGTPGLGFGDDVWTGSPGVVGFTITFLNLPAGVTIDQTPNSGGFNDDTRFAGLDGLWVPIFTGGNTVTFIGSTDSLSAGSPFFVNVAFAGGTVTTVNFTGEWFQLADDFEIRYFSNVNSLGDSLINLTNTGANAGVSGAVGFTGGNICANIYVFDPGEEELACCSCQITPNALQSTSVAGLLSNNLTLEHPNSTVVKVLATAATSGVCDPTSAGSTSNPLVPGLRAWATTLHQSNGSSGFAYGTETEFSQAGDTL